MSQEPESGNNNEAKTAMDRIKSQLLALESKLPETVRLQLVNLSARWRAASRRTQSVIAGGAGVLLLLFFFSGSNDEGSNAITFPALRGDLEIAVLEGGALEATQSQELRSQIKGREGVKILSIVEEGYRVSPQDVDSGLILVELDTAALIDEQLNQEISVETAEASYIESRAQYEIQLNQNASDLNDARQTMRFARLDFEKFLGGKIVGQILGQLQIDERLARAEEADRVAAESPTISSGQGERQSRLKVSKASTSIQCRRRYKSACVLLWPKTGARFLPRCSSACSVFKGVAHACNKMANPAQDRIGEAVRRKPQGGQRLLTARSVQIKTSRTTY